MWTIPLYQPNNPMEKSNTYHQSLIINLFKLLPNPIIQEHINTKEGQEEYKCYLIREKIR